MLRNRSLPVRTTTACILLSLVAVAGCAKLFHPKESGISGLQSGAMSDAPTGGPTINVVHLEIAVLTPPVNDRRVRTQIWEELDETGLMEPSQRNAINDAGIRVGVSGGNLGYHLESLLNNVSRSGKSELLDDELSSGYGVPFNDERSRKFRFGSVASLLQDGRTRIGLRGPIRELTLRDSQIDRSFSNGRTILEVSVRDQREEWVELEFLPQIDHGKTTSRYTIAERGDQLPQRQNHYPLYEQQFRLKLHRDEIAVVGRLADRESVGDTLFLGDSSSPTEKLIVVRLIGIEKVEGQSSGGMSAYRRQ